MLRTATHPPIAITGIGLVCPLGNSLPAALDWIHDGWAFGDGSTGSAAIDIDWDYFSIAQGAPGFGQANTAAAMLFVFEPYWFPGVFPMRGAPGQAGPFRIAGLNNGLGLQWSGPGGAPFALLLAPTAGLPRPFGCGGNVDIGTAAGFADLAIAFDPTVPVFGSLFMLTGSGHSGQTLQLPSFPPGFLLGAIQGVVFQPPGTSGCGYRLTAAFELRT